MADYTLVVNDAVHAQSSDNITLVAHKVRISNFAVNAEYVPEHKTRISNFAVNAEYIPDHKTCISSFAVMVEYFYPPPRQLGPAIQNP